jgi:hypothetical protein
MGINGFGMVNVWGLNREPLPAIGTIIFMVSAREGGYLFYISAKADILVNIYTREGGYLFYISAKADILFSITF